MPTLRAGDLLRLWEQAEGLPPLERALSLAAGTGGDPAALRSAPFGRTNEGLLAFRELLEGSSLEAKASCPACAAVVEFTVDADALRRQPVGPASARESTGELLVDWRAPTPEDLMAVAAEDVPDQALRERCLTVSPAGMEVPAELVAQVEEAMAAADPLAEVLALLTCPECGVGFESDLDVGAFVWAELDARAKRLLHEVDTLARSYGWTEAEVLALSERRREAYLQMVLDGAP
jgi:hypothetical protein